MRILRFVFLLVILIGATPLWMMAVSGLGLQMTAFEPDFYLEVAESHGVASVAVERLLEGMGSATEATEPKEEAKEEPKEEPKEKEEAKEPIKISEMSREQMVNDLGSASMKPKLRTALGKGLAEIQAFVWGGKKQLHAPVDLAQIKESYLQSSRGLMAKELATQLEERLGKVPNELDLALAFGPLREPMEQGWNARRINLWVFAAGLGLLLILVFMVGGFGSGLRWLGLSWLLAGLGVGLGAIGWDLMLSESGPSLLVVASPLNAYVGVMLQALVDGSWAMMRNIGFIAAGVGLLAFFVGVAMTPSGSAEEELDGADERLARTQPKKGDDKKKKIKAPVPVLRTLLGGVLSLAVLGGLGFFGLGLYESFAGFEPAALRTALVAQTARDVERKEEDAAARDAVVAAAARGVVPEEIDESFKSLLEGHDDSLIQGVVVKGGLSAAKAQITAWEVVDLGARMVREPQKTQADELGKFSIRVSPGALVLIQAEPAAPELPVKKKKRRKAKKTKRKKAKSKKALPPVAVVVALGFEGAMAKAELDLSGGLARNLWASLERLSKAHGEAAQTLTDRHQALLTRHAAADCARIDAEHPDRKICENMVLRRPIFVNLAESLAQGLERQAQPLRVVKELKPLGVEDLDRLLDEVVLDNKAVQSFMSAAGRDKVTKAMVGNVAGGVRDKSRQVLEDKVLSIEEYLLERVQAGIADDLAGRLAEQQTATMAQARDRVFDQLKKHQTHLDIEGVRVLAGAVFDRLALLKGEAGEQTAFEGYDPKAVADRLTPKILAGIRAVRTTEEDRLERMIPWVRALELFRKAEKK